MQTERDMTLKDASLPRLVALFISPFALWGYLEKVGKNLSAEEAAGVHYRNSLFLFTHVDKYIDRWSKVVWGGFIGIFLLTFAVPSAFVYLVVSGVMMAAILHVAVIGVYRQTLNDRIDKYSKILGVERPRARDKTKSFPSLKPGESVESVETEKERREGGEKG